MTVLLSIAALLIVVLLVAVLQAIVGAGLAVLIVAIVGIGVATFLILRLSLAPAILLTGAGPIEALIRSWHLSRGRLGIVFRWLVATIVLIGVTTTVIGAAIGAVFDGFGQLEVGQLIGAAITGPVLLIEAIVLILLARLLSGPVAAPEPPELPTWMSPSGSARPPAPPPVTDGA